MLKVRMVEKSLQGQLVLNRLDMDVDDGCIYGLIGPNGAGKSTLLRVMAGVYKPDLGCVSIDDHRIDEKPEYLGELLLISDDPYFFRHASLAEMKQFYKISFPDLDEAYYRRLIRLFHLNDQTPLEQYSKGMKRQAFLILGLCASPRYLLLDEAFDGLDPHMRMLFKKEIAQRLEDRKMSVVISSHNLREMEEICDCFGILEKGRLITSGSMSERLADVHRYQLAFSQERKQEDFQGLSLLSCTIDSRIVNLVVEGDRTEVEEQLRVLSPLMMERLDVSLEEVFVYTMMRREELRNETATVVEGSEFQ